MRTNVLAAVAAAVLLSAVPASADPPSDATYTGGCDSTDFYEDGTRLASAPDQYLGVVWAAVAATSPTAAHNPVRVDRISCEVRVDGVLRATWWTNGVYGGTVLHPWPMLITHVADAQTFELCTVVRTTDFHGQTVDHPPACRPITRTLLPAQEYVDVYDGARSALAAALCPALDLVPPVRLPGQVTPDQLTVDDDGDVWLQRLRVVDCAPLGD
jgi:hypothetical protein